MDGSVLPNLSCSYHAGGLWAGIEGQANDVVIVFKVECLVLCVAVIDYASSRSMENNLSVRSIEEVLTSVKSTIAKDEIECQILLGVKKKRTLLNMHCMYISLLPSSSPHPLPTQGQTTPTAPPPFR